MEDRKLYLEEDEDLLEELEKTNKKAKDGIDVRYTSYDLNALHIKTLLRTGKAMDDYDKSNKRFSVIVFTVAFLQLVIALFQYLLEAHWLVVILLVVFMLYIILDTGKWLKKEE